MAAILKNVEYDVCATVWPIFMKFGKAMHIRTTNLMGDKNLKIWKSEMADGDRLGNKKMQYLQKNFLADFNEILHCNTY